MKTLTKTAKLCSGFGRYHTDNPDSPRPRPFTTISYQDITQIAKNPPSTPKPHAQWVIPSSLLSRSKVQQFKNGKFHFLYADLDNNPPCLSAISHQLQLVVGGGILGYTSKSATENCQKSHILIPVSEPLTGLDWKLCQSTVNDKLAENGIEPDRKSEYCNQILYLPNRGIFYQSINIEHPLSFNPLVTWHDELSLKKQALLEKTTKSIKPPSLHPTNESIIHAFNENYSVEDILLQAGYDQKGTNFRHPNSNTGNYSASIKNQKVHTLSSSDPLFLDNGGAHSAYGAFVILFHNGNRRLATIDAGDNWLMINDLSWNTAKRRAYMEQRK
jgi:hypothetical protein